MEIIFGIINSLILLITVFSIKLVSNFNIIYLFYKNKEQKRISIINNWNYNNLKKNLIHKRLIAINEFFCLRQC